jgi:hypothetical protein
MLQKRLDRSTAEIAEESSAQQYDTDDFSWRKSGSRAKASPAPRPQATSASRRAEPKSFVEEALGSRMAQNVARQATRSVTQSIVRGIFGMLKGK